MRKISYIGMLVCAVLLFSSCSKKSNPVENNTSETAASYYPGGIGSTFIYSIDSFGKKASDNVSIGTRTVVFTGTKTIDGTQYTSQTTASVIGPDSLVNVSYFRTTDAGDYLYIDTTGFSAFVPDSLKSLVTINFDKEVNFFIQNFQSSPTWNAYSLNAVLIITFNVLKLTATYQGSEDINLNLTGGQATKTAQKIKYELILTIPNVSGGPSPQSVFDAYAWYVKDIGLVKIDGNATVLEALAGYGINFADTTKNISQSLTSYTIK